MKIQKLQVRLVNQLKKIRSYQKKFADKKQKLIYKIRQDIYLKTKYLRLKEKSKLDLKYISSFKKIQKINQTQQDS